MNTYKTPIAEVRFSYLNTPNRWGNLSISLLLDKKGEKEVKALIDKAANEYLDEHSTKAKPLVYNGFEFKILKPNDKYPDEKAGSNIFELTKNSVIKTKDGDTFNAKVLFVDSQAEPMEPIYIPNGSKVIVEYNLYIRSSDGEVKVKAQPKAVQIIDLVQGSGGGSGPSFEVVEGGFTKEDLQHVATKDEDETGAASNGFY